MVYCLGRFSGQPHWKRELSKEYEVAFREWPVVASGIVLAGIYVFNLGSVKKKAGVNGLDVATGKSVWQATIHAAGHATPSLIDVAGELDVVLATFEGLLTLSLKGGTENCFFRFSDEKQKLTMRCLQSYSIKRSVW